MQELPFKIPRSLNSYVEKFEDDPETVIAKLRKHLKRRGPDAVGHFLLAWFLHLQQKKDLSVKEALKAKTFAPGSPLMEHLHYYLLHPEKFDADIPVQSYTSSQVKLQQGRRSSPLLDLDKLIAMLEAVETRRITIPEDGTPVNDTDLSKEAEEVDDVVSETLAKIHSKQGRKKEAIKMYERLIVQHSDKADVYTEEIEKLKEDGEAKTT